MSKIRGLHAELIKESFSEALKKKGHKFFDGNLAYNVNIIGVRNTNGRANKFDDFMVVVYRDAHKRWSVDSYQITTDPGFYWMKKPMNVNGTAILCPGQYRGVYRIDKHRGKYDALCQRGGAVTVWRDSNRDLKHDIDDNTKMTGYFGINLHKGGRNSSGVNKWSAGCQVIAANDDWTKFMKICRKARNVWGNNFTYTLIDSKDIIKTWL